MRRSVVIVISLFAIAALGATALAASPGPTGLEKAKLVQELNTDRLLATQGVVGTAVGIEPGGAHSVLVLVEDASVSVPSSLDGVRVRRLVTGPIGALHHRDWHDGGPGNDDGGDDTSNIDPTSRFDRPVPIGVSTGHPDITAGTIGARVIDSSSAVYALSNNHVYADENRAKLGDPVLQPGPFDGGTTPDDDIGTLSDYVEILFDGSDNVVDAAIASSSTSLLGNATPSDGYGTPSSTITTAVVDMRVQKYGRTTALTDGRVKGVNATVNVAYDSGTARFVNQIVIGGGGFSRGGDSGSLIVTTQGSQPVGLLFAGGFGSTIANPIDAVLAAFSVTVDGS